MAEDLSNGVNIQDIFERIKGFLRNDEGFLIAVVLLVGISAFGLGRASVGENEVHERTDIAIITETTKAAPIEQETVSEPEREAPEVAGATSGAYVGSKNSDKYHLPWCPGAQRIKEENEVWFETKAAAEAAGYKPAGNCKGL